MLSSVPDNACIILDEKKYYQFVWPEGLVLDENKKFIGFYMPYVDATETYNFIEYIKKCRRFFLKSITVSLIEFKLHVT
jgi:hypothetical protein